MLIGSITRSKAKKLNEVLNELVQHIWVKSNFKEAITYMIWSIINQNQVQEGSSSYITLA